MAPAGRRPIACAGQLTPEAPRAQDIGESKERAESELHGLPPAERHAGPDGPPHRLERRADAKADPPADRAVERKHRGHARAEPGQQQQPAEPESGPQFFARLVEAVGEVNQLRIIEIPPAEPRAEHHDGEAGEELPVGVMGTVEGQADEGAAKEAPRRTLDDKSENGPPEGLGLQAEADRLAVGLLSAKTDADGGKRGDEARIRLPAEQQAEDETDHRSGDHGAERAAANGTAQSPAERHRDGAEHAPIPERACRDGRRLRTFVDLM